ncbi:ras-responsive element-binding 1-like [Brachionus plicatilis]|uniref:Ras-responsive element-binding 1-like n=1 Tax=Brachionus plicatilis TaxID=10195 RepID=A0A3M7R7T7_BRAPC|nr:ras-responsive element-binding 1-like [Brachionus plicatilis]
MESKVKLGIDSKSMRKKATNTKQSSSAQSVENESVNSDKSSVKNAQTIAAAFNSESPKSEIYTIDFSNNKKVNSDRMDEIIDPDEQDNFSTSTQSSTSVLNNVSMEPDSLENSKLEDSNDSLADTIAQVASGSISSDTKKIIEDKQNEMIMKSKLKKEIIQIPSNVDEDSKNSKSPRLKQTKTQGEDDSSSATAAVDAAASSLLSTMNSKSNSKPKLGFLTHKNMSSKRKRLLTLKSKIEFLRAKKLKKNSEKDTEKGEGQETDEQNDHDPMRTCLICKLEMNQDVLNEHVMKHFYETAKCCSCTKVSSNPANFVVHILTHLPPQFYCVKCDKWYRQGVLYKRHKQECSRVEMDDQPMMSTRQKRKSSVDSIAQQCPTETKRRRGPPSRLRVGVEDTKPDTLDSMDKRRPGRPKKSDEMDDKPASVDLKRKYGKKNTIMDANRKKGLRSFGKKSEPKGSRLKRRGTNQDSDLEWIETDSKSNATESLSEVDNFDEVVVSDMEEESQDESKAKSIALTGILAESGVTSANGGGTLANAIASLALKPNMDLTSLSTYKVKIQPTRPKNTKPSTPSKSSNNLANFECPECDKKFVSYFGLVQHYDQHPNLSVYCQQCDIEFENHYGLVVHNSSVHQIVESQYLKNKLKQAKKDEPAGLDSAMMSMPSIMTRTSRLNTDTHKNSHFAKPSHLLEVKTSGFADLALIDFSCVNFPRIAQTMCELWPRKIANQSDQPLHHYQCDKCGFFFPCSASLKLHNSKKYCCKLFMTNSKFGEYEKSVNEIVAQIEDRLEPMVDLDNEATRDEFMSWFGLVNRDKLGELSAEQTLLDNLRSQMLDVNHGFRQDLDRWKLTHSSPDDPDQSSSKIHLKPFVNLARPLLLRSKKFKRSTHKFVVMSKSDSRAAHVPKTMFTKPFFSATTSGNFSAASKKVEEKKAKSGSPILEEKEKSVKVEEVRGGEKMPEPPKLTKLSAPLAKPVAKPVAKLPNSVKAPIVQIPTQCSSANSSRLASASGMSFPSFRPIMPKLLPINNQSTALTSPPPVIPKLRKHSPKAKLVPKPVLKPIAPKPDSPVRNTDAKSLLKCKFCMECWAAAKPGRSERGQNKAATLAARPAAKNLDREVGRPKHRRTARCTAKLKTDGHFGGQFLIKRNEKFSNITYKSLTSNQEK